jgi:NDP-hexose-3,4-dehydratase
MTPRRTPPRGARSATNEAKTAMLAAVREYHEAQESEAPFVPGVTPLLSSGPVFDCHDRVALVDAALDMRIVAASSAREFERRFARMLGLRKSYFVNSGSSANLLAVSALTSPKLGSRRLRPGDEVITVAAGFPTTVNPILQNGLVPVFVDVELPTYNASVEAVEAALSPRTRAIILAHTLGNPYAVGEVAQLARAHDLWLIEDNCDALGSTYRDQLTGTFGDLSTSSFYPAHHITTGEGGCVAARSSRLGRIVESMRDWGRDCWCNPGEDDRCGKRFGWQLGTLPEGYDHKYVYSHIGYNLKATDQQAALGVTQLQKLPAFGERRRRNWRRMRDLLGGVPGLMLPSPTPHSDPSWFGFPLTVLDDGPLRRRDLVAFLEGRKIATRQVFAGNLIRHPAYERSHYRIAGDLGNSDIIAERSFWIGVHPGLTDEMIDYMASSVWEYATSCYRKSGAATFTGRRAA